MTTYPNFQYIVIKSDGTIVNYYYHSDFGICSSVLSSSGKWNNAISNAEDAKKDYSINIDNQNTVYIVYRNDSGSIKVIIADDTQSKKINVLQSKSNPKYNMYPKIFPGNEIIHILYIIENSDKKIICHQTLKEGKPQTPTAVDYIVYNEEYIPYSAALVNNKLVLLYTALNEEKEVHGYKVYDQTNGKWSKFYPLSKPTDTIYSPVISSYKNKITVVYVKSYEDATYIVKRNISEITASLSAEQEVVKCSKPDILPQILMTENSDIIFWSEDREIFYVTDTGGTENLSVNTTRFGDRYNTLYFNVVSNEKKQIVQGNLIPGNFTNGLTLSFIKLPIISGSEAPTSLKSYISSGNENKLFELMQSKILDMEKKIRILNERISILEKKSGL